MKRLQIVFLTLLVLAALPARADDLISLDCTMTSNEAYAGNRWIGLAIGGGDKHVWINTTTDVASDDRTNSAAPSYGVTVSPAKFTATKIEYSSYWPMAAMTYTVIIDRTTGELSESRTHLGQPEENWTYSCVKSTTPQPARKF